MTPKIYKKFVDDAVLTYLEHQIGSGNPVPTKNALEDLCALYRRGYRIHPSNLYRVQTIILGLSDRQDNSKVQRWVLNALAQVGQADSRSAILRALEDHACDPGIVTAGIAALYKLSPQTAEEDLRRLRFPGQMVTLAALQHTRPEKLVGLPVNVQTAHPETIKAALVVVGLNRAPPHLFDPDYSNAEIVKVVGKHDDAMVSQYSIWAITENPSLNINDMGIDPSDVASRPKNVRGWVYRLSAMNAAYCREHLDFIEQATRDGSVKARLGLARGVKDTFFEALVPVVLDWFTCEVDAGVRQEILDHVIKYANKSQAYHEHAIYAYSRAGERDRERMKGTAVGTPLFPAFRQIDVQCGGDLFMTSNVININNSQIAALSASGAATNTGQVVQYQPYVVELLKSELARAGRTIESLSMPEAEKRELASVITDAQADPNSGTLKRVVMALSKAAKVVTDVAGAGDALSKIIENISKIAGFN